MICYFDDQCPLCIKIKNHYEKKLKKVLWIGLSKTMYSRDSMIVFVDQAYVKEQAIKKLLRESSYPLKLLTYCPNLLLKWGYEFLSKRRFFLARFL